MWQVGTPSRTPGEVHAFAGVYDGEGLAYDNSVQRSNFTVADCCYGIGVCCEEWGVQALQCIGPHSMHSCTNLSSMPSHVDVVHVNLCIRWVAAQHCPYFRQAARQHCAVVSVTAGS